MPLRDRWPTSATMKPYILYPKSEREFHCKEYCRFITDSCTSPLQKCPIFKMEDGVLHGGLWLGKKKKTSYLDQFFEIRSHPFTCWQLLTTSTNHTKMTLDSRIFGSQVKKQPWGSFAAPLSATHVRVKRVALLHAEPRTHLCIRSL